MDKTRTFTMRYFQVRVDMDWEVEVPINVTKAELEKIEKEYKEYVESMYSGTFNSHLEDYFDTETLEYIEPQ